MNLIGSIIRRLGINIVNSSGSTHQTVRDSNSVYQAGRDVHVNSSSEAKKTYPKIGEACFPDFGLTLSVHDFRAGEDMGHKRYRATLGTKQIAKFVVTLQDTDYETFGIRDNQGPVSISCMVTVPEGRYEGEVTFIEIGQRESSYLGLCCWFKIPARKRS